MEPSRHQLARISPFISRWLGHRSPSPSPLPSYSIALWSFIAAFCGMSLIQAALSSHYFTKRAVPPLITSCGASAVLIYGYIDSPLAQPRALIGGHCVGALLGICISKLFQLLPPERYNQLQWLAGSLSVSLSLVAMQLTKTVHPPAGATALLATVNQQVIELSWYLLPVILLSCTLSLIVALFVNNIQRKYPVFWFTVRTPLPIVPQRIMNGHEDGKTNTSLAEMDNGNQAGIP